MVNQLLGTKQLPFKNELIRWFEKSRDLKYKNEDNSMVAVNVGE